jgi:hypothetical protein
MLGHCNPQKQFIDNLSTKPSSTHPATQASSDVQTHFLARQTLQSEEITAFFAIGTPIL